VTARLLRTAVLVGMMGAGKTAVGTALAAALGVRFTDSDDEIERAANATITEIFARDGEAFFRAREAQVIARLLAGPPQVLSVGGGAFLAPATRDRIARRAVSVWLDADLELLWNRVRHRRSRPLLRTADPRETLARLHAERAPVYALAAVRVVPRAGLGIEETAAEVLRALQAHGDVAQGEDGA